MNYLCAFEAMNLDNLFGDCEDLSTSRGGGLAVLNIATQVATGFVPSENVILAGASKGLIRVNGDNAEDVRLRVAQRLAGIEITRHATVFLAVREDSGSFPQIRAELDADLRWQQMQAASVVYPPLHGTHVCAIDRVRPARSQNDLPEKSMQSEFTSLRRRLGREQRSQLVREIVGDAVPPDVKVAEHLGQLVGREETQDDDETALRQMPPQRPVRGRLDDKIALLRFDGNDFGKRSTASDTPLALTGFSDRVRRQQREFFRALLLDADGRVAPKWWTTKGSLAIEIVVYGGDEVTFIVPAALGWRALRTFYEQLGSDPSGLTYAGAIVFCHYKTPIHSVKRLASELVDLAKELGAAENGGEKTNFAMYQVLESFDSIGTDLQAFIDRRYSFASQGKGFSPRAVAQLDDAMPDLRGVLSRRKLHSLAHDLERETDAAQSLAAQLVRARKPEELRTALNAAVASLIDSGERGSERAASLLDNLHALLGSALFLHLVELWDYVGTDVTTAVRV